MKPFTNNEKNLIKVSLSGKLYELEKACIEDQGVHNGKEGTLGREQHDALTELLHDPRLRMV